MDIPKIEMAIETDLDEFKRNLQDERIVDIYTKYYSPQQPGSLSFRVPATTLKSVSEEMADGVAFAIETAEHERTSAIRIGCNRAEKEWEVLLFWAYHRELPQQWKQNASLEELVDAWQLADDYEVVDLQDLIMLELLRLDSTYNYAVDELRYLCRHEDRQRSDLLFRFMGEAVVRAVEVKKSLWLRDLQAWREYDIAAREVTKAYHRFIKHGKQMFDRFGEGEVSKEWWKKFMVGEGPKQHWVHEKVAEGKGKTRKRTE